MNTHLHNSIVEVNNLLFIDCQNQKEQAAFVVCRNTLNNSSHMLFWKQIKPFFDNDIKERKSLSCSVPCDFVNHSNSFKAHRQHAPIFDSKGHKFYIDALTHKDKIQSYSDSLSLGAVAYGLIYQEESLVFKWFDAFRKYSLYRLLNTFVNVLKNYKIALDKKSFIVDFHRAFFSFVLYSNSFNETEYSFNGLPDLNILFSSSNNCDCNAFELSIMKIIQDLKNENISQDLF